jgi:hypothetical protein
VAAEGGLADDQGHPEIRFYEVISSKSNNQF